MSFNHLYKTIKFFFKIRIFFVTFFKLSEDISILVRN